LISPQKQEQKQRQKEDRSRELRQNWKRKEREQQAQGKGMYHLGKCHISLHVCAADGCCCYSGSAHAGADRQVREAEGDWATQRLHGKEATKERLQGSSLG